MSDDDDEHDPTGVEGFLQEYRQYRGELRALRYVDIPAHLGLGPGDGRELGRALADAHAPVRLAAAEAIGLLRAPEGGPALVRALKGDPKLLVRRRAAWSLGCIGPAAARAVPALLHAVRDRDEVLRRRVIEALGRIGAPEAVPALLRLLDDRGLSIRFEALLALRRLGRPEAAATLVEHLPYEEALQPTLLSAIGACADRLPETELALALGDAPAPRRAALFVVLGDLRRHGPQVVPILLRGLAKAEEEHRALADARGDWRRVRIVEANEKERRACIAALGCLGAASTPAIEALRRLGDTVADPLGEAGPPDWACVMADAALDDIRREALLPASGAEATRLALPREASRPHLALAAALGHMGARRALGAPVDAPPDLAAAADLCAGDDTLRVRFGIALARPAITRWERGIWGDMRVRTAVEAAEAWLRDPTPERRSALVRCADFNIEQGCGGDTSYVGHAVRYALGLDGRYTLPDSIPMALGEERHTRYQFGPVPPPRGYGEELIPPLLPLGRAELLDAIQRELIPWALGVCDPVRDRPPPRFDGQVGSGL